MRAVSNTLDDLLEKFDGNSLVGTRGMAEVFLGEEDDDSLGRKQLELTDANHDLLDQRAIGDLLTIVVPE